MFLFVSNVLFCFFVDAKRIVILVSNPTSISTSVLPSRRSAAYRC